MLFSSSKTTINLGNSPPTEGWRSRGGLVLNTVFHNLGVKAEMVKL